MINSINNLWDILTRADNRICYLYNIMPEITGLELEQLDDKFNKPYKMIEFYNLSIDFHKLEKTINKSILKDFPVLIYKNPQSCVAVNICSINGKSSQESLSEIIKYLNSIS